MDPATVARPDSTLLAVAMLLAVNPFWLVLRDWSWLLDTSRASWLALICLVMRNRCCLLKSKVVCERERGIHPNGLLNMLTKRWQTVTTCDSELQVGGWHDQLIVLPIYENCSHQRVIATGGGDCWSLPTNSRSFSSLLPSSNDISVLGFWHVPLMFASCLLSSYFLCLLFGWDCLLLLPADIMMSS